MMLELFDEVSVMKTLDKMTLEELEIWMDARIDEKLQTFMMLLMTDDEPDDRTWEQVKADIERDRWTPPPNAKSSLELLREDRDR